MKIYDGRKEFYQWDLNQKISSDKFTVGEEIHFWTWACEKALVVIAYEYESQIVVDVPNILLQNAYPIKVYRYIYGEDESAQTVEEQEFDVIERAKPEGYIYSETDIKRLEVIAKEILDKWKEEAIEEVTRTATQNVTAIFNSEISKLNEADKQNSEKLEALETKYAQDLKNLQNSDKNNAENIAKLRSDYEKKVAEIIIEQTQIKQQLENHISLYNSTISQINSSIQNAIQSASNAQSLAGNAQSSALNAQKSANEAQQSANNAQNTANNAVDAANEAQDTANNALELVNDAYDKAVEAQNTIDEHKVAYDKKVVELEKADNDNAQNLKDHIVIFDEFKDKILNLLESDDVNLDEIQEIVNYIKANKGLIDAITINKVSVKDIVDDLVTKATDKPLSANQGVVLKGLIDALTEAFDNHKKAYNQKVEALEQADKTNADNLDAHKDVYNVKVAEIDESIATNAENIGVLRDDVDDLMGKDSKGLEYSLSEDGTYYIVSGIGTCNDKNLVIPRAYNGKPIKEIGEYAFRGLSANNYNLHITIKSNITKIGRYAFYLCTALKSIIIPDSVTDIGVACFSNCTQLESVVLGNGITILNNETFIGCIALNDIHIPKSITSIGNYCFMYCRALESIIIYDSVSTMGFRVFGECNNLNIYCQSTALPNNWHPDWNSSNRPVIWDYSSDIPSLNEDIHTLNSYVLEADYAETDLEFDTDTVVPEDTIPADLKFETAQKTSGELLALIDGIVKSIAFSTPNKPHSVIVRDDKDRAFINPPLDGEGGRYQIANRLYVDNKAGGSTSISVAAGQSQVITLSCTDHAGTKTDVPRGLYNGTGVYVLYSGASNTIEIVTDTGAIVQVGGKFIIMSVTPHSTTNHGIRVCVLYYDSLLSAGWKHAYTVLGKKITIKAPSSEATMVHYHQISPFRAKFPT